MILPVMVTWTPMPQGVSLGF